MTVTVGAVNDAPVANASSIVTNEDTSYLFTLGDFGATDVDAGDSVEAIRIDTLPLDGTLYLDGSAITVAGTVVTAAQIGNGELLFMPDADESGSDAYGGTGTGDQQADYASFEFSVSDGSAWSAASATMSVDVLPVVDAPTLTLNSATASDGSDLLDQVTVPTAVGMTQTVYSAIGLGGALLASDQLETISDGLGGGVSTLVTQPYRDGGNDVDNVDADSIQVTTGVIYLEAGSTLSFNGYNDDALLIEVGGQTLIRTTGDAWGDYDTSLVGTFNSTGGGAGTTVETYGDFVAPVSGYYTFEMYIYNHNGPGDLSVNAVLDGVETAFNTDNFLIYPDIGAVEIAEGQHSAFVSGPEVGTDGGVYPVEINTGVEGTDIKLSAVESALVDTDGSESLNLVLSDIPAGSTVTDGTNSYTAPADGSGSVNITGWNGDTLTINVPGVDADTTYTLLLEATSTEDATGETASVQTTLQVTVLDSTVPVLADNTADVYEAAMPEGTDSASTGEIVTGNLLSDDVLPNGATLTNVVIAGGTTDTSVAGQITVTTAEGNALVVDTATGDYTYTLLNAVDHVNQTTVAGTGYTVLETYGSSTEVATWSGQGTYDNGTMRLDGGESASKTFDLGSEHANQTVTITLNLDVYNNRWEEGSDQFTMTATGGTVTATSAYDDATVTLDVTLDNNGRVTVQLDNNASQYNETAFIDNFTIVVPDAVVSTPTDTVVDSFTYTVQNTDGVDYNATLDVTIHDDAPTASPQIIDLVVEPVITNLTVIVDGSGSMDSNDLNLSMDAINALVSQYSALGGVNINIVQFFAGSATNTGWIDSTSGVTLTSGGSTDIYQGLYSVVNDSYGAGADVPEATQNVVYFFGDGDANYNEALFDSYVADEWTQFVNSGTIDKLFTYSVNTSSVMTDIATVADNGENDVSPDAVNISSISQLSDAVSQTVGLFTEGSLTEDAYGNAMIDFGADGGHIASVTIGANSVDYDPDNVTQTVSGTHGDFEINFETGAFRYLANDTTDYTEVIEATITDNDGDLLSGTVLLEVNIQNAQQHVYDGTALDAGDGFDTITLATDADLDFSGVDNIANIEKIDLSVTGDHQLLNLNAQDVLDMTDADHELFIDGGAGDRVTIDATLVHKTAADGSNETMEMNGHVYDVYTDSSHSLTLHIDQNIQVDPS